MRSWIPFDETTAGPLGFLKFLRICGLLSVPRADELAPVTLFLQAISPSRGEQASAAGEDRAAAEGQAQGSDVVAGLAHEQDRGNEQQRRQHGKHHASDGAAARIEGLVLDARRHLLLPPAARTVP